MKLLKTLFVMVSALFLVSCHNYKEVAYFQNSDSIQNAVTYDLYNAHIMPKDLITITVNTTDPEASIPFNLTVQTRENTALLRSTTQPSLQQYLVNNEGKIKFPVLGELEVGGLTVNQTEALVCEKLKPYLKETPIVTVRLVSFKVSVMGEVSRPGQFSVSTEKINVLEALALAGDLTIWGRRDNVKLIRETRQGREIHEFNLNDANIIASPYYQLEQNDIIYVTPNKTKAKNSDVGTSTSLWFSATSIVISLASLLYNILK